MTFDPNLLPDGAEVVTWRINEEPMSEPTIEELREWSWNYLTMARYGGVICGWQPDKNIEQAWELVDHFTAKSIPLTLHSPESGLTDWACFIGRDGSDTIVATAATAPEAILRAAWAAREVL